MLSFEYTITDELGIHARPAGLLVKEAGNQACAVKITKGSKSADAKRIFSVMGLAVKNGDTICIECDGEDELASIEVLKSFFEANL